MKNIRVISFLMLATLFMGMSSLFASCRIGGTHGDGNVKKETRSVSGFDGIKVSGAFNIILSQGATEEVIIEADENILPLIITKVEGGMLKIYTNKPIHNVTTMKAYITVKDIKRVEVSGACDIVGQTQIKTTELSFDASGASDSKLDIAVQKLKLFCSGASKLKFSGIANEVTVDCSGATDLFAFDLLAESYDIDLSGAGEAEINVSKRIHADVSGAGSIRYKGSPTEIDQNVSGAGSIKKLK